MIVRPMRPDTTVSVVRNHDGVRVWGGCQCDASRWARICSSEGPRTSARSRSTTTRNSGVDATVSRRRSIAVDTA